MENTYYDSANIEGLLKDNDTEELWTECNEISKFNVEPTAFAGKFPEYTISGYNEAT